MIQGDQQNERIVETPLEDLLCLRVPEMYDIFTIR